MGNGTHVGLFSAEVPAGAGAAQLRRTLYELEQRHLAAQQDGELAERGVYRTAPIPKAARVPVQRRASSGARTSGRTKAAAAG